VLGIIIIANNKEETIENHKVKVNNSSSNSKEMVFNHIKISNSSNSCKAIIDREVRFRGTNSNSSNLGIKAIKGRTNNSSSNTSSKMVLNHGIKLLETIDNLHKRSLSFRNTKNQYRGRSSNSLRKKICRIITIVTTRMCRMILWMIRDQQGSYK